MARKKNMQEPQGYYQQDGYYEQNPKRRRKRKRRRLLFAFEILILLLLAAGLYVASRYSQITSSSSDVQEKAIQQNIKQQLSDEVQQKLEGYWNIALYGVDSRDKSATMGQSDTIIVCSINKDTKDVKLASVYRDSYLEDTTGNYNKATDVYAMGGPERSINMLNKNLDLDISDYVTVNMDIVATLVNAIGGVEIDVREEEILHLNNYQNESSEITGLEIVPVTQPGLQTLNGLQAISYCRIRYIGLDYERTERQRKVINQIFAKVKTMDPISLTALINQMFDYIETNLSVTEILALAKDVSAYNIVETTGFPYSIGNSDMSRAGGSYVVSTDLASDVKQLHTFLFGEDAAYQPSDVVKTISDEIAYRYSIYQ
ncbi:MAG: LCP family protein [Eubacteriales bacterium]|nr:LCP family protein [Eubacteriales bacterium]